jgi:hypothetical protein
MREDKMKLYNQRTENVTIGLQWASFMFTSFKKAANEVVRSLPGGPIRPLGIQYELPGLPNSTRNWKKYYKPRLHAILKDPSWLGVFLEDITTQY